MLLPLLQLVCSGTIIVVALYNLDTYVGRGMIMNIVIIGLNKSFCILSIRFWDTISRISPVTVATYWPLIFQARAQGCWPNSLLTCTALTSAQVKDLIHTCQTTTFEFHWNFRNDRETLESPCILETIMHPVASTSFPNNVKVPCKDFVPASYTVGHDSFPLSTCTEWRECASLHPYALLSPERKIYGPL